MKKIIAFILIFNFFIIDIHAIEINSNNAVLYNINDDKIIYEKNKDEKVQIASLTKIVTAVIIIDNINDLNREVLITDNMLMGLNGYAKAGFKVGDKVTYLDLLYALMLPSGADAAQALAISYSNTLDNFVLEMNNLVSKLNLTHTHFTNPIGMDDVNNYSTANELSIILKYALNNDIFKEIYEKNSYVIKSINLKLKKTTLSKAKQYNLDVSNIRGSKTGYTDLAGYCLTTTASINNVDYLLVTLGADTSYPYHIKDAVDLYNYYSSNYSYKTIIKKDEILYKVKIKGSKQKYFDVISNKDIMLYLNNDFKIEDVEYVYSGVETVTKKIKNESKIGVVNVKYKNDIIYTYNVYLNQNIKYYNYILYIEIFSLFILIIICYKLFRR